MDRNRLLGVLVVTLALSACQASGPAAPTPAAATPGASAPVSAATNPTSTTAPKPTVDIGPAVALTLDRGGPVVGSTGGVPGHHYANPAAAARDRDGGYVLFIVWFADAPGDQVVTVARSDDGTHWRVGTTPIYTDLGMDLAHPGPGPVPAAAVQLDDGSWQLYGWAAQAANPQSFSSWRASAPKPEGPWTLELPGILEPGAASAWDGQTAAVGAVQRTTDGYALWYEGQGPGSGIRGDIGYATSTDGLAWQQAGDPVIRRGVCGPGTSLAVYQPEIEIAAGGGYLGAVGAYGISGNELAVFGVTSADGRHWRCGSTTPILQQADVPGSAGIHTLASMPLDDGTVALLVESLGDKHSDIWLATMSIAH